VCRPFHLGQRTQVWQTEIQRPNGKLACVSRLTTMVLDAKADEHPRPGKDGRPA
jgi:1,4-dihydroxy-2-naphthoyl-CoA hydrolase